MNSVLLTMGRLYSIANHTNQQIVDAYYCWKENCFCNCHEIMHQMKWDKTDDISSFVNYGDGTYDHNFVKIIYNRKTKQMYIRKKDACYTNDTINLDLYQKYAYDRTLSEYNKTIHDHIPEWSDNKCVKCGYVYDETRLDEYAKGMETIKNYRMMYG